ncbi:RND transporter [Stenotrophobium rhamnosiphilum]|uniref:RND transporter n=2 Tax=Stenotrophobium rhamnosiphilum TaxID=2029166 RepID=A0A2T5ME48_9GAMM|nr:RND transporter [Stenotrophobium rhamnosiphilum]
MQSGSEKEFLMRTLISIVLSALALTACAVGPDYRAPETPPTALLNASSPLFVAKSPEAVWWNQFEDEELDSLISRALEANLDLRIAIDRVREARAVFVQNKYDFAPHAPMRANYSHADQQQPGLGSTRVNAESYSLGFDATWEIDLFGRVRRSVEAAKADLGAQQANLRDAQVTIAAEVARNYFELRGTQKRLDVARRNLTSQDQTQHLTQLRYDAGRITELNVQQSRARLKATEASIPPLEAAEKQYGYRLAVLLGQRPGALDEELKPAELRPYAKALPIGDVTTLLRRRPDVRIAEREFAAATARVGVATADLFPRVNVTGFVGFLSGDFGRLFNSGAGSDSRAWSVTPSVSWAALDFGSVKARLRASKARSDAAAVNYEKVVLTALEDTENSFVAYSKRQAQLKSLNEQADASRRAADIAQIQYREGVADFLTLLDTQRTQLSAEDAVAEVQTAVNVDVVAIYKALGGVGQVDSPATELSRNE